eukprot:365989-Chlamydomonas_euryale.AAC.10
MVAGAGTDRLSKPHLKPVHVLPHAPLHQVAVTVKLLHELVARLALQLGHQAVLLDKRVVYQLSQVVQRCLREHVALVPLAVDGRHAVDARQQRQRQGH